MLSKKSNISWIKSMKKSLKMLIQTSQSQTAHMKSIMSMGLEETISKQDYILEKITMRLYSQVLLLALCRILLRGSKSFLEELKRKKMLRNIRRDSLSTKMTSQLLTLPVVSLETLLWQENVENCQRFTFGIISRCNRLEAFSSEHKQKE